MNATRLTRNPLQITQQGSENAHGEVVFAGRKAQATSRKGRAMQQAGKKASESEKSFMTSWLGLMFRNAPLRTVREPHELCETLIACLIRTTTTTRRALLLHSQQRTSSLLQPLPCRRLRRH